MANSLEVFKMEIKFVCLKIYRHSIRNYEPDVESLDEFLSQRVSLDVHSELFLTLQPINP